MRFGFFAFTDETPKTALQAPQPTEPTETPVLRRPKALAPLHGDGKAIADAFAV